MPIKSISRRRGVGCPHRPVKLRKLQSWGDHSVTLSPSRQGRAQERMRSHVYKFKVLELECANRHIYIYIYVYIYMSTIPVLNYSKLLVSYLDTVITWMPKFWMQIYNIEFSKSCINGFFFVCVKKLKTSGQSTLARMVFIHGRWRTYRSSMHYHHLLLKTKLPFCNERRPKEQPLYG